MAAFRPDIDELINDVDNFEANVDIYFKKAQDFFCGGSKDASLKNELDGMYNQLIAESNEILKYKDFLQWTEEELHCVTEMSEADLIIAEQIEEQLVTESRIAREEVERLERLSSIVHPI